MRIVSAFILFFLPFVFASDAGGAVTSFRVLMDVDNDIATGCLVQGMTGVDQVLTTEVATGDEGAEVTRTTVSVCSGGVPGPEVELTAGGWPAGYQPASGATLVETSMPFSLFPGGVAPAHVRLGLAATQGAASHVALTLPNGSSVIYPPTARGRRRSVAAPGAARVILLDGEGADWNGLDALFDGIAGTGSPALRMLKFYAFADQLTETLFFRFDANLSSDAPFATDDVFSRAAGEGLTVVAPGVLANDGDPNDLPLTALPVTPAAHGNVVLNPDGSFTYTPVDASSTQTDAFEYRASNGAKTSNPARVEITVSTTGPVAPVASDDAFTTSEDESLVIAAPGVLANDADGNGDPLTSTLATPPAHGTVTLHADGGFTYAPQANYFGSDTFTYTVSDGAESDTAQVTITIVSVNDAPVIRPAQFDLPENSASGTVVGTVGVSDPDSADSHTFTILSGNVDGAFAIAADGTLSVANAAAIDFEINPQFVLSVRAKDDGTPPLSDTRNVTISILDENDVPVAAGQAVATNEDTPVAITLSASDEDGDSLTWTIITAPANGTLSGAAPNLTYTPNANYFGADGFTFRVNDGAADSALATVQITIAGVNDVPVAVADAFAVDEAGSVDGNVLANDSDVEGPLTAVLDTNVSNGTLTFNANGTFTYVHDGSETTSDSFTYHATDGAEISASVTVTITVNPVNDAPVNTVPGDQVTTEDLAVNFSGATALSIADADAGAADVEVALTASNGTITLGSTTGLTFTAGANGTATMTFQGTIANINLALASLDFAPTPNFFGIATLSITTNDLGNTPAPAASDSDAITITVTAENDAPVAADDTYVVDEGGTLNEAAPGVLGNDTDVDSTITAVLVTDVTNGTLTLNADGSFEYTHDGSETTSDSFTYRATDGTADSAEVTVTITINPVNDLPVFTSSNAVSVPENGTAVLTVTTTDAESDVPTYSITGGADAARFAINATTGALSFTSAPDFEAPADADVNNVYLVEVTANDGTDGAIQAIAVTVTNVDEAPVASDATFALDENSANGTAVGSVTAVDPDAGETLTYAITAGNTGGAFAIDASTGAITVANVSALDFEATPTFALTVSVTDNSVGALSDTAAITINLNNLNEAPVVDPATVALDENSANGTAVHTVTFTEPDATGQTHTFAIIAGNDSGAFAIDANSGAITVASVAVLDFETTPAFALTVEVTDVGAPTPNLAGTATITINLNDLNENPVVDDQTFSVDENSANGTVVGTVVATDQDAGQTLTYAITGGNALGAFAIDASSGQITVADTTDLDFETNPTFSLTVLVTDDGAGALTDTATITITLTNLNEAPSITPQAGAATLAENSANGTVVLAVTANDPDAGQTLSYAITGGNTGGAFAIDGSGVVTVATTGAVDFETNPTFTLTIEVTDNGTPVATDAAAFVINLTNVNEAPVVDAQTFELAENSPNGTAVGTATFTDQDAGQTHTFAIIAGNDLGAFAIDANSGAITVADVTDLDFETNPTFALTVEVTDNGAPVLSGTNTITINLTDANEAPIVNDQAFNVDENSAIGTVVGTIAFTDSDGPTATFSITAGNAGGEFAVNSSTGQITVAKLLNYEVPPTSFVFTIEIADGGTPAGSDTAQITINVNDLNEAPVVDAASVSIDENTANGSVVTTVTFTEPDAGQTHTFAIVGGNTGGAFAINATTGEITVANVGALNFEATPSFSLTVEVTDDGTPVASGQATITVTLNDLNDAPVVGDAAFSIAENASVGASVGTAAATDEDAGQTLTYSITGGNTGGAFSINASTGEITVAAALDYETLAAYSLTVMVQDDGAGTLSDTATVTITVTNVNEAPIANDASVSVDENVAVGSAVTVVSASDPDGDGLTFAITAGNTGGTFTIHPTTGAISIATSPDFETTPSYSLTVTATDTGTLSDLAIISVTINNLNEAPVVDAAGPFSIAENTANATNVGTPITFSEPDGAGQTHTYSITGGNTGGAFTIDNSGQISVATSSAVDFESTPSFTLTVTVTDDGVPAEAGSTSVTINLTDVNEAPVLNDAARSVDENAVAATHVGLPVTAVDEDVPAQTLTYSIIGGNTGDVFAINSSTGQITVAGALDFEGPDDPYTLVVQVQDDGAGALTDTANVTITLIDVNEAPVLNDAARSIDENSTDGTVVGAALPFTDPDSAQTHTFAITGGDAGGVFAISNAGQITVANSTLLNYEATQSFSLTVQITDSGAPALSDTATVTITVNDVNEAPTAGTDAYVYIANTELRIGGHAGNATAVASTSDATKVIANDTDPDTLNPAFANLSITPVNDGASANGGVYSIAADGSMVYTPPAGFTGTDSVTYSLTDGTNSVSGTINFTRDGTDRVWYVKNNATAPGAGTSTAPFATLLAAQGASAANDIIYVLPGDGTTTNQNAGFTLKNNQKLWGNGVPLVVNSAADPNLQLIATGAQPQIGNATAGGAGVSASNLTGVVQIRGLNIAGAGDAVSITANGAETIVSDNTIRSAGNEGIDFVAATGTPVLSIANNIVTATGTGISVTGAAVKTLRTFADNTITGNTVGSGIVVANAAFDSSALAGLQPVAGGTISIGVLGNDVGLAGMSLTSVQGTLNLTNLGIYNANGSGLVTSGSGAGLTLNVNSGGGPTGNIESTGGPAVDLSATAADLRLVTLKSTNSSTTGVSLTNVTGIVSAENGSSITNATGTDFAISGGTANVTYKGTITDDVGQLISIANATSGTKSFTGAITDGDDGDGSGISLTSNTGATINFSGGITLSTGVNPAFAATGGGTINVTGTNKLTTTNGVALNVANTTIGSSNLLFQSINVDGNDTQPASGIILNNTGSLGGLRVTGTGTANSGGTIRDTGSHGISLTNTAKVALDRMNVTSNLGSGINGFGVNGFTLDNSSVTANGDSAAADESGIYMINLTGTDPAGTNPTAIRNTTVSNNWEFEVVVENNSGTLTNLLMNSNVLSADGTQPNHGNLMTFQAFAGVDMTLNVTGGSFTGNTDTTGGKIVTATGLMCDHSGFAGTVTCNVAGATFTNNNVGPQGSVAGGGKVVVDFNGNTVNGSRAHAINFFADANPPFTKSISGKVRNNVIGNAGANSGSQLGYGIRLQNEGSVPVTLLIDSNTIENTQSFAGINVNVGISTGGTLGAAATNLSILNNSFSNIGSRAIILQDTDASAGSKPTVCIDMSSNFFGAGIFGQAGNGSWVRIRELNGTVNVRQAAPTTGINAAELDDQQDNGNDATGLKYSISGTPQFSQAACPQP